MGPIRAGETREDFRGALQLAYWTNAMTTMSVGCHHVGFTFGAEPPRGLLNARVTPASDQRRGVDLQENALSRQSR